MKRGSRRQLLIAGFGACLVSAPSLKADILSPGSKRVSHKMKFENIKEYEKNYKFFFLPLTRDEGLEWLKAQEEFGKSGVISVSGINPVAVAVTKGFFLVAVPRSMLDPDGGVSIEKLRQPPAGILKSERLVGQIRAVDVSDEDEFWTIYHVKIVDGKLQTGLIRHDEPKRRDQVKSNSFGSGGLALISAITAAGAIWSRFVVRSEA